MSIVKLATILILSFYSIISNASSQKIIHLSDIQSVKEVFVNITDNDLILFDICDVLLLPDSDLLRHCGKSTITDLLNSYSNDPKLRTNIEASILKNRVESIIDKNTLPVLSSYQTKNLLFLTSFPINENLNDTLNEDLRYRQLLQHNINSKIFGIHKLLYTNTKTNEYSIYNNILFCKNNRKDISLDSFLKDIKYIPRHIYFIDDRINNLEQIMNVSIDYEISFTGIYYTAAKYKSCNLNNEITNRQINSLKHDLVWLNANHLTKRVQDVTFITE